MSGRILIIDDDVGFSRALGRHLRRHGHETIACGSAEEASELISKADADVILVDWQLPDQDGLGLLAKLRPSAGSAVFIMATAYPDLEIAVEAMRRGAFDYVSKASELEECVMRIERGVEVALMRRRMAEASQFQDSGAGVRLIGDSGAVNRLRMRLAALPGADDTTVAIQGETGTGKGVIARLIHAHSGRAYEPMVAVDCTTIPANLIESELFGHEKGAFTGATGSKMGRVEAAGRGTLFIDEIGELPLPMQAKLLRLLEEREYSRVGSTKTRKVQARIITATNRDLEQLVADGRFRADLRYRLEVFVVETPPLRDRSKDVLLLAAHFAEDHARALGRATPKLHPAVVEALQSYRFPGNVRELKNMIEQAILLANSEELTLAEFPVLSRQSAESQRFRPKEVQSAGEQILDVSKHNEPARPALGSSALGAMEQKPEALEQTTAQPIQSLASIRRKASETEAQRLGEALSAANGNVSAAARALGLSRHQLMRRLRKYGMT
ncbi:MAG: sigma-54 dependent transcriptional regulator [Myxococcota bacterium]